MSSVNIMPVRPRPGTPSSLTVPSVVARPCTYCGGVAMLRCEVCMSWYCSGHCQASHWPKHRRDCVQPPALLWSDGSKYEGEKVECLVEEGDQEMMSMTTLIPIGSARLEQVVPIDGDKVTGIKEKVESSISTPVSGSERKVNWFIKPAEKVEPVTRAKIEKVETFISSPVSGSGMKINSSIKPAEKVEPVTRAKIENGPPIQSTEVSSNIKPDKSVTKQVQNSPSSSTKQAKSMEKNVKTKSASLGKSAAKIISTTLAKGPAVASADEKTANDKGIISLKSEANGKGDSYSKVKVSKETVDTAVGVPKSNSKSMALTNNHEKVVTHESRSKIERVDSGLKPEVKEAETSVAATIPEKKIISIDSSVSVVEAESKKAGPTPLKCQYIPAILSTTLPTQILPSTLVQVVLPVDDVVSPGQFGVRLLEQESQLNTLLEKMNTSPPPIVEGWQVGRRETVAVMEEDIWYRGLAVRKMGEKFQVYLLDYGGMVEVQLTQMRPLPADCTALAAASFQVCLAGLGPISSAWGEQDGQLLKEILNGSVDYKLGVEFVGQVEGDRWAVKLRGIEDEEDIGRLLLGTELVRQREDVFKVGKNDKCDKQITSNSPAKALAVAPTTPSTASTAPSIMKVPRGVLSLNTEVPVCWNPAVVCYLETPKVFYVCPLSKMEVFSTVLISTQDCPAGAVVATIGSCCLVQDEDCWYRGEIVQVGKDKKLVQLFLLDYGKAVESSVDNLKPIPDELVKIPGLVCKVNLIGIKPIGKDWSKDEIGGAEIVLDVGKDTTHFLVNVQEVNADGQCCVNMKDMEGNDVAKLMVDIGIAVDDKSVTEPLQYKAGCLVLGTQNVVILNAVSPMQVYLCSMDMFMQLSNSIAILEKEATQLPPPTSVNLGDVVLARDEGTWYRAKVCDVTEDKVAVELVDIGSKANVCLVDLRVGTVDITKEAVNAVSCCLDSWFGEDQALAMQKWGEKIGNIVEPYTEMEVDVVEKCDNGQFRIRVPELEKKLKGNEVKSRAEMLKEKLRKK